MNSSQRKRKNKLRLLMMIVLFVNAGAIAGADSPFPTMFNAGFPMLNQGANAILQMANMPAPENALAINASQNTLVNSAESQSSATSQSASAALAAESQSSASSQNSPAAVAYISAETILALADPATTSTIEGITVGDNPKLVTNKNRNGDGNDNDIVGLQLDGIDDFLQLSVPINANNDFSIALLFVPDEIQPNPVFVNTIISIWADETHQLAVRYENEKNTPARLAQFTSVQQATSGGNPLNWQAYQQLILVRSGATITITIDGELMGAFDVSAEPSIPENFSVFIGANGFNEENAAIQIAGMQIFDYALGSEKIASISADRLQPLSAEQQAVAAAVVSAILSDEIIAEELPTKTTEPIIESTAESTAIPTLPPPVFVPTGVPTLPAVTDEPTDAPSPIPSPISAPTSTPTPPPTDEPIATATSLPTNTPIPPTAVTIWPTPVTIWPTHTPIPALTWTPLPPATALPVVTNTPFPATLAATLAPTPTQTPVPPTPPTIWPTHTPTPWPTRTPWPTHTTTPWPTRTPWPTATFTPIPTPTPNPTSPPPAPTATAAAAPTNAPTATATATATSVPTSTPTATATATSTPTATPTSTPTITPTPTCSVVPSPIARWQFETGSGAVALETASSNYNGTLQGGVLWSTTAAKGVGALNFDGIDDFVRVPYYAALNFGSAQDFAITLWVQTTSSGVLVTKSDNGLAYPYDVTILPTGDVEFSRFDGTNSTSISSSTLVNDGAFHFVAVVKDGATVSIYIDGVLDVSGTDNSAGPTTNNQTIRMGIGDSVAALPFTGLLDDVRIYDVMLCATDVPQIMAEP